MKKDILKIGECPTCGIKLVGDRLYFHCNKCGGEWLIDDLEYTQKQKTLMDFVKG